MAEFGLITLNPLIVPAVIIGNVALLVGQNIYDAVKKIGAIDHIVHLSADEYAYEFIREFIKFGTDPYIKHLVDEKQANEHVASKLFEIYPDIKRFVVSASIYNEDKSLSFIDNNEIDLTKTRSIEARSRAMPAMKKNRTYFCTMSQEHQSESFFQVIANIIEHSTIWQLLKSFTHKESQQEYQDFFCLNAFGISTLDADHSQKIMFLLFDGVDYVNGFPYASNIFQIGNGSKLIRGGDCDDYFKIIAEKVNGHFDGGDGYDTIDLSEFSSHHALAIESNIAVEWSTDWLENFKIVNIESIIGRRNFPDHIVVCNQSRIDLSGTDKSYDRILINEDRKNNCIPPKNLTVYLRKITNVICRHPKARVTYMVMEDTQAEVEAHNGSHHFYFRGLQLTDIRVVAFDDHMLIMRFGEKVAGSLLVRHLSNVSMEFEDGVKIKSSGNSLVAHLEKRESLFDVIEKYNEFIGNNTFMTLVAETMQGRAILSPGQCSIGMDGVNKLMNIIVNNDKLDAYLIGRANASNYFLLFGNRCNLSHVIDVKIYAQNSTSYIDLHQMARSIQRETDGEYGLHVSVEESPDDDANIELKIRAMPNKGDEAPVALGKITIIDGIMYIDTIIIKVYGSNSLSMIDDESGGVKLQPLSIYQSDSIVAILPGQVDFYSNLIINSYAGKNLEPYFVNGTLMLTNLASQQSPSLGVEDRMTTIFLHDFKLYKNKYRTIDLIFQDRMLKLQDYVRMSSNVESINAFWNKLNG